MDYWGRLKPLWAINESKIFVFLHVLRSEFQVISKGKKKGATQLVVCLGLRFGLKIISGH